MRTLIGWIIGLYHLAGLLVLTRGRFQGSYWSWRWHTAFGRGVPATKRELLASAVRYGRWMGRMRRLG